MVWLITNRKLVKCRSFFHVIEEAVKAGVDAIILREKDLDYDELIVYAEGIKKIIKNTKVQLIINSNLQVAKHIGAHGYHIDFERFMKEKCKEDMLIGVSVHSLEEAILAEKYGASYVLASHIYETNCKKGLKPKGIKLIEDIKVKVKIPIIALGGIKPENVKEIISSGADGIAVMSYIMGAYDPFTSVIELKENM